MSSKTKIVVLHMKEIIYTVIISIFVLLLIVLFFFMFSSRPDNTPSMPEDTYQSGLYTSEITLNNTKLAVEVAVSNNQIEAVRISNLDESIMTMYPLLQPTIENLSAQICELQSLDQVQFSEETPYTERLLLNAIEDALTQANQE